MPRSHDKTLTRAPVPLSLPLRGARRLTKPPADSLPQTQPVSPSLLSPVDVETEMILVPIRHRLSAVNVANTKEENATDARTKEVNDLLIRTDNIAQIDPFYEASSSAILFRMGYPPSVFMYTICSRYCRSLPQSSGLVFTMAELMFDFSKLVKGVSPPAIRERADRVTIRGAP